MLITFLKVVTFIKSGSKKKKITKADRLKQILEEEEKRQKEEVKARENLGSYF